MFRRISAVALTVGVVVLSACGTSDSEAPPPDPTSPPAVVQVVPMTAPAAATSAPAPTTPPATATSAPVPTTPPATATSAPAPTAPPAPATAPPTATSVPTATAPPATATAQPTATPPPPTATTPPTPTAVAANIGSKVGERVPDFDMSVTDGTTVTSVSLIEVGRPAFLFFYSST